MRVWGKRAQKEPAVRGVARAALAGASRGELVREALKVLTGEGNVDRIGIWLEAEPNSNRQNQGPGRFQGAVWDRENAETPREWATLSMEVPLPEELLLGGKSVQQDLEAFPARPIIGPLVELRSALWIPIARLGQLKGVILAGGKGKQLVMPRESAESVAAELSLAIQLEEEQRIVRTRNADLGVARRLLSAQDGNASPETLLSNLADSCTARAESGGELGASFAVIGVLTGKREGSASGSEVKFHWRSGDEAWTRAIESEPLSSVWRRALEARRVIGSAPQVSWAQESVARIVALPLESQGQLLGTLVAGLPGGAASLATLERLELRAALAAAALGRKKRNEKESYQVAWQQALLEASSEAMFLLDEAGRMAAWSRGARDLAFKASRQEAIRPAGLQARENFAELFRGQDRERVKEWLRAALRPEPAIRTASADLPQAELHNGARVRVRMAAPAAGGCAAVLLEPLAAGEAASERDRAQTELQNVLEWLEEGVVLFDTQENLRAMNTRFQQIAGLAPDESRKIKTLEELITRLEGQAAEPQQFAERWRELARGIEGGVREELQMARPAPRILERAARPVQDAIGRHLGRVEIYRDLTAQRVFQSKLLQTEKLAALGQMVSGIAHELSNPLTSILGYAQRLLVRSDASGRRMEEVRQIYQEAERAGTILRQLLLNARETLPERRLVSLNQIVLRAMELQRFSLAAEKMPVEIDLDPGLPFVQGDPGQLQQVLMNLVSNAQQAIKQQGQGGAIRLRTKKIAERRVRLEVEDTGPGIPQAIQARIFDPFFTTKPAGVGTGLGLAIVLSVVREHGGRVHVLSPPQGGAVFQIELPAVSEIPQDKEAIGSPLREWKSLFSETAASAKRWDRHATVSGTGREGRVLVVEDEPTVARLIGDVLEDEGMSVDVLLDGREALDRAAREAYDLVICDMKMPGLDGQHFYKSLMRVGSPLKDRFLFVTGDIVGAQTREFLQQNHLPHVAKPFRVEELTEKVHQVLDNQARHQPSAAAVATKNITRNG